MDIFSSYMCHKRFPTYTMEDLRSLAPRISVTEGHKDDKKQGTKIIQERHELMAIKVKEKLYQTRLIFLKVHKSSATRVEFLGGF